MMFKKLLPDWLQQYQSAWLAGDVIAGAIVTIMLIPQSLAYAMLAGLPPQAAAPRKQPPAAHPLCALAGALLRSAGAMVGPACRLRG